MVDVYRVGVSLVANNHVGPVLTGIASQLIQVQNSASTIGSIFGGWRGTLIGVGAVLAGGALIKGLEEIVKHGTEVNHQLNMMAQAGMKDKEIQDGMVAARKTSSQVLTTSYAENLKHIRELRYAFGEETTAIAHLDKIMKANTILNAIRDGKGKDEVWELVKSLEGKNLTYKPEEFDSYVDTMTKVVQATGGRVTPQMFMSTFKYGRTATLGWEEGFVGGALPRLIQSMSSAGGGGGGGSGGPGNALMSAFAKVVQGQMPKTAAEEFDRLGLGKAKVIEGSAESQIVGGIRGRDLFISNPYEWVQQVLLPAMKEKGLTSDNDVIQEISKLFPVRTASQVVSEMALQGRYREGAQSPFEKDIALQKQSLGVAGYDELVNKDIPTIMLAFHTQFRNLLELLGGPLMAPGGPVVSALASMAVAMGKMAQFGGENAQQFANAVNTVIDVISASVRAGLFIGDKLATFTGVKALFQMLGDIPWDKVQSGLTSITSAISSFIDTLGNLVDKVKNLFHNPFVNPGNTPPVGSPMRFDTGKETTLKAQPISLSLNLDGRTIAQAVTQELQYIYEHASGAPSPDGMRSFRTPDAGMYGT